MFNSPTRPLVAIVATRVLPFLTPKTSGGVSVLGSGARCCPRTITIAFVVEVSA